MSTQPGVTTVADGDFTFQSNSESADSMIRALKPKDKTAPTPREVKPAGEETPEKRRSAISEHAAELGKRGGKAAAKARKTAEADAEPGESEGAEPETSEAKGPEKRAAKKPAVKEPAADEDADAKEREAASDAADEDDEPETEPERRGNPRKDPEARIQVLARERRELRQRVQELENAARRPAEAREERQPEERREARPEAPQGVQKPKLADFLAKHPGDEAAAFEEYQDAREDYTRRTLQHEQAQARGREEVARHIGSHVDTFRERLTGKKKGEAGQLEAYDEYMDTLPSELVSQLTPSFMLPANVRAEGRHLVTDLIIKSERSRDLLEHFADNPSEFQRIAALRDPLQIAGEMAILTHGLDAATAGTSSGPEISRAKPPARPVAGMPRAASGEPGDDASLDEHIAYYDARDREKRRKALRG